MNLNIRVFRLSLLRCFSTVKKKETPFHGFLRSGTAEDAIQIYKQTKLTENPRKMSRKVYNIFLNKLADTHPREVDHIRLDMERDKVTPDNSTYIALIKAKAATNDIEGGMKLIEEADKEHHLKLRNFAPLLRVAYQRDPPDLETALKLWDRLLVAELQPLEGECLDMIEGILHHSKFHPTNALISWHAIDEVFRKYLFKVSPSVSQVGAERLLAFFETLASGLDTPLPSAQIVDLNKKGVCSACGTKISVLEVDADMRSKLVDFLFEMTDSIHPTHCEDLKEFARWFDNKMSHKPFTVIIDAANVAYHGQNSPSGSFNFHQIDMVVRALQAEGEHPLVILPQKYMVKVIPNYISMNSVVRRVSKEEEEIRDKWKEEDILYIPSNRAADDDWYWLYPAAAHSGVSVVTNDATRNHRPDTMSSRLFQRWRSDCVRNFLFRPNEAGIREVVVAPTAQFSREMQPSFQESTSTMQWHIPISVRPAVEPINASEAMYEDKDPNKSWLCVHIPMDPVLHQVSDGESYLSALCRQIHK